MCVCVLCLRERAWVGGSECAERLCGACMSCSIYRHARRAAAPLLEKHQGSVDHTHALEDSAGPGVGQGLRNRVAAGALGGGGCVELCLRR